MVSRGDGSPVSSNDGEHAAARIDTSVAHPARRYNYWLGGKDHFAADRESGDAIVAAFPTARASALENRAFLRRAVAYLAGEAGVRQFLDIGTGIPAPGNTHEVAQAIAPDSRVVYVDNDPIVGTHARALLSSTPQGATTYLEADLREHEAILSDPYLRKTLDLAQPVGLLLVAVVHFLEDTQDPYAIVDGLLAALPSGSYLVMSHATADHASAEVQARVLAATRQGSMYPRRRADMERFFAGLELVAPGIVSPTDWRAEDEPPPRLTPAETAAYGAVARRP